MSTVAVITDTDASLPADVAARYAIRQVPINVHFGEEVLRTGIDIDDAGLFARIDREGRLPTTSAPSPGQFLEAYQAAFAAGADGVACLCVSSAISATYQAAVTAAELLPDRPIMVVDHLAAGFGNLLSVKPVLTLRDGKLELLEKVRTRSRALARVIELAGEAAAGQPIARLAVLHVNAPEEARAFEAQIRAALPCPQEIVIAEMSAGLSVHTGAGMLGVALVTGA